MDLDGKRLLAKYYDTASPQFATLKSQQAFERTLHSRTASHLNSKRCAFFTTTRTNPDMYNEDEVAMLNGYVAVYRANLDLIVYVVGTSSQNELVLTCALDTIFDVFSELLKYVKGYHVRVFIPVCRPQMDKSGFVENFELVALALDEIVDRGCTRSLFPSTTNALC